MCPNHYRSTLNGRGPIVQRTTITWQPSGSNTRLNFTRGHVRPHLRTFSNGERRRLEDVSRCLIHGPRLKVVFSRTHRQHSACCITIEWYASLARPTFKQAWFANGRQGSEKTGIDLEYGDDTLTHRLTVMLDQCIYDRFYLVHLSPTLLILILDEEICRYLFFFHILVKAWLRYFLCFSFERLFNLWLLVNAISRGQSIEPWRIFGYRISARL